MKVLISVIILLVSAYDLLADGKGIPEPSIDILHYQFSIAVNDSNDIIEGVAVISVKFNIQADNLALDLKNINQNNTGMRVFSVSAEGQETKWEHSGNILKIKLPKSAIAKSTAEITISYSGVPRDGLIISKNKFGDRTFFADHWPDRASNYLPVVDHPSDKAAVDFIITAPSHYRVVASGYLVEESPLANGTTVTHWKEDVPLAVKVMAFAAAPFATELAGVVNNIPVWTWVYMENRKEGFNDYKIAIEPMQFYSKLIGQYSYEKLANVQSKTIFGGLENAGCIFYAENSVTGEGKAEGLIAHEIAHQWFGNSVTEKDWHHIWLSEGFATYLTDVYIGMKYGEEKFRDNMRSDRNRVFRSYHTKTEAVIDTTITNLMSLLNASTYQKGGWVLHMLRIEIGDEAFWKGMRLYYEKFRNGNALTSDFENVMEKVSGKDLKKFFYQWLYIPGEPDLKISTSAGKKKGTVMIKVEQTQDYLYTFTIDLQLEDPKGKRMVSVPVRGKETSIEISGDVSVKITPDPEVKLFFRSVEN
jgi:aminopeptidase N